MCLLHDFPEKRVRVAKSKPELDELPDDSTDIYKSNIIERYIIRPSTIPAVDNLCLAEFAAYYYKEYKTECIDDAQPEILSEDVTELHVQLSANSGVTSQLPPKIKLLKTNEVMKCRKSKAVIRYHTPNKTKEPEQYFHHLLVLYYPWRNEDSLLGSNQTYASKFYEPEVQSVVTKNRALFEPDADAVSQALEALRSNEGIHMAQSFDSLNDQQNDQLQSDMQDNSESDGESFNEQVLSHLASKSTSDHTSTVPTISSHIQPEEISDDLLRESVRVLNNKQRIAYDIVVSWCRNKIKKMLTQNLESIHVDPIYLFITGGAGSGKSHLIKTIYHTAVKTFRHARSNANLPTVLLMAPTGVSAINISGTTVNTALAIPKETGENLPAMSDQKRTQMRVSLSELKLIIIDEVSMISNITLLQIHQRLKDIFGASASQLFAGLSVVVVGDLYQLPPIRRKPIFESFKNDS